MYDMDKSKRRVAVIDGEVEALNTEKAALVIEIQKNCTHSNVVESPRNFIGYRSPLRGCVDCHLVEIGLYGFEAFKDCEARQVSGDEIILVVPDARRWQRFFADN